jgi:hypothetical protein
MAKKKKKSVIGPLLKNIGISVDWIGNFIWNVIHRVFELVFWVWGFALVTILIATAAFLFLSLGIKALDQTSFSQNILQQFIPDIVSQRQAQSLPDILSEFTNKDE